jgi:hypothetical protein
MIVISEDDKYMVLAVDFDQTVATTRKVGSEYKMGAPEPGAVLAISKLQEEGHTIVIFTARNVQDPRVYKAVEDWLKYFNIPHSGITNIKRPEFDVYIDDRCLHFTNWQKAIADLSRFQRDLEVRNYDTAQPTPVRDITKPL